MATRSIYRNGDRLNGLPPEPNADREVATAVQTGTGNQPRTVPAPAGPKRTQQPRQPVSSTSNRARALNTLNGNDEPEEQAATTAGLQGLLSRAMPRFGRADTTEPTQTSREATRQTPPPLPTRHAGNRALPSPEEQTRAKRAEAKRAAVAAKAAATAPERKRAFVRSLNPEQYLRADFFLSNLPFIGFVGLLALFYIGNNHAATRVRRNILLLEDSLTNLRDEYVSTKNDLMGRSRMSAVALKLEPTGLRELKEQPIRLTKAEAQGATTPTGPEAEPTTATVRGSETTGTAPTAPTSTPSPNQRP